MQQPRAQSSNPMSGPGRGDELPSHLPARVVRPGSQPTLHGFDVQEDLARHYSFAELILVSLTGQAPSREIGRAFELVLVFLSPVSVALAPTHAACLARMVGADDSSVLSCGALGLSEQARDLLDQHADLLRWLGNPSGPPPSGHRATDDAERGAVRRLRAGLPPGLPVVALLEHDPSLVAACLMVLHASGLHQPWQLAASLCFARWPTVVAESFAGRPCDTAWYPPNLPSFVYVEEPRHE